MAEVAEVAGMAATATVDEGTGGGGGGGGGGEVAGAAGVDADAVCRGLVREYLFRKGMLQVLERFDAEVVRGLHLHRLWQPPQRTQPKCQPTLLRHKSCRGRGSRR